MNRMDNKAYLNDIMKFIKILNKWREFTGDYSTKPIAVYKYPRTIVLRYIDTDKIYYYINMYKRTHKSKWINRYRGLIMKIKDRDVQRASKRIRVCNNSMVKLITRKRGMIR